MATRDKEKYDKACNYCIENRDQPQKEKINHIVKEYNYSDSTARLIIRECRTKEEQEYYKNKYGRKKKDSRIESGKKSLREKLAVMQKYEEQMYIPKSERKPREKFIFDDSRL